MDSYKSGDKCQSKDKKYCAQPTTPAKDSKSNPNPKQGFGQPQNPADKRQGQGQGQGHNQGHNQGQPGRSYDNPKR